MVGVTGVDAASGTRRFAPSPAAAAATDAATAAMRPLIKMQEADG